MSNCNPPTCSTIFDDSCESLDCVFNVDAVNINNLFRRTNDLKDAYEEIEERLNNVEVVYVTNAVEFSAAINNNKHIFIKGNVTLDSQFTITIPTKISGEPGSLLVCTNTSYVFDLAASLELSNLKISGASSNSGYLINIGGTQRSGIDSYLRISNCWFENIGNVVTMTGGPTSPIGPKTTIYNCDFKNIGGPAFNGYGAEGAIMMDWNLGFTVIDSCRFHDGTVWGNAIWLGHSAFPSVTSIGEALYITRNQIINCHRNGIETFIAGNAFIIGNYVEEADGTFTNTPSGSGIGISAAGGNTTVANNYLKNIKAYAIEIQKANNICTGNTIDGIVLDDPSNPGRGISVDGASNSVIKNNLIKNLLFRNGPLYGIVCTASSNISVKDNYFDSVSYAIWIAWLCENITVRDNDFNLDVDSTFLLNGFSPGACIVFSGVNNKMLNNVAAIQPTLAGVISPTETQTLFSFNIGAAGHVDFIPTYIGPVGSLTGVTNTSSNIAI